LATTNAGLQFLGDILSFDSSYTANPNTGVRYLITGDTTSWYYWNGTQWTSGTGYNVANTKDVINNNIGSFYDQLYPKVGGKFRFQAYLHSDGDQQESVDWVKMIASEGRIVVLSPNGTETGTASWVTSVTYPVTWSSTGKVSNFLVVDLYDATGNNFIINTDYCCHC